MREDGKIDYIELPGTDLPATKGFYAQAFGWSFIDYGPQYAAFDNGGGDGGFNAHAADRAKAPLVVLFATDLQAMHAQGLAAGGQVTRPLFIFPRGRSVHFSDPSANAR